jgi:hypothetical protein
MATRKRKERIDPEDVRGMRKAVNERKAAPSGSEYPLDGFGGGKVVDRGVVRVGEGWRNR